MAQIIDDPERQVIPRWRVFSQAAAFGEISSLKLRSPDAFNDEMLAPVLEDWKREPGLSVAADVVSASLAIGRPAAAKEAAKFLLSNEDAPLLARELAERCLGFGTSGPSPSTAAANASEPESESEYREAIHKNRLRLSSYPINPVLWTNQAFLFTTLGQRSSAEHAMRVALGLAPDNRFVARAGCRLFLHTGDVEKAHDVLLRVSSLLTDPWILAGELAVASVRKRTSRHMKKAQKMAEDQMIPPFHLSELVGALASAESNSGNLKKARKLSMQSLVDPAENAIAQARYFNRQLGVEDWKPPEAARWQSSEANAHIASTKGEFALALVQAKQWQTEQPFSSRPANLAGYLAMTVFEEYAEAERLLMRGLRSNRTDFVLYNNLAFALANMGRLQEAQENLNEGSRLPLTKQDHIFLTATQGLIAFRAAHPEMGRKYYAQAIASAETEDGLKWAVGVAKSYLAIEELRLRSQHAAAAEKQALEAIGVLNQPFRELFAKKLRMVQERQQPPIIEVGASSNR